MASNRRKSNEETLSTSMHGPEYDSMSFGASSAAQLTNNLSVHSRPVSRVGLANMTGSGRSPATGSRLSQASNLQGDIISQTAQKYMSQFAHSLPARPEEGSPGAQSTLKRVESLVDGPRSLLSIRGSGSIHRNNVLSVDAISQGTSAVRASPIMRQAIDDFGSRRQSENAYKSQASYTGPASQQRQTTMLPIPGNASAGGSADILSSQSQGQILSPFSDGAVSKRGTGRRQTINFLPNGDVEVTGLPLAAMKRLGPSLNARPSSNNPIHSALEPYSHSSTGGGMDDQAATSPQGSGGGATINTGSVASSGGGGPPIVDASHFSASLTSQGAEASSGSSIKRSNHPYVPSLLARTASGDSSRASGGVMRVHLSLPPTQQPTEPQSSSEKAQGSAPVIQRSKLSISVPPNIDGTASEGTKSGGSSIFPLPRLDEVGPSSLEVKGALAVAQGSSSRSRMGGSSSGRIDEQRSASRPHPSSPLMGSTMGLDAFQEGDDGVLIDSDEDTPADTLRGHYEGPMSILGGHQPDSTPYHTHDSRNSNSQRGEMTLGR